MSEEMFKYEAHNSKEYELLELIKSMTDKELLKVVKAILDSNELPKPLHNTLKRFIEKVPEEKTPEGEKSRKKIFEKHAEWFNEDNNPIEEMEEPLHTFLCDLELDRDHTDTIGMIFMLRLFDASREGYKAGYKAALDEVKRKTCEEAEAI